MIRFSGNTKAGKDIFKRTETIGIIASAPETDTATASIALANYYRSAKGYNTALAIVGEDRGFADMLSHAECVDVEPPGYDDGVLRYYVLKSMTDLEKMKYRGLDRIVIDLGGDHGVYTSEELMMTDRIYAMISTTPWRRIYAREFLFSTIVNEEKLRQRFRNMTYSVSGSAGSDHDLGREFGIGIRSIRDLHICDPYRLTKENLKNLNLLLE
ncbi:MAG: hypothetical protein PUG68_06255 [Lachnospiraceae bacterium]|nr:hypothetical protein [Lachnospiraceae bacterium]MDD7327387.1 hypothetical protein [Lachnospiraceae bacterium]MDY2758511.1 hypothetical protein [Lachnospiraceae bacterium]